jgi:hypothetical protein
VVLRVVSADYLGVCEEVGVHVDELLVGVGDAHANRLVRAQAAARNAAHVRSRLPIHFAGVGRVVRATQNTGRMGKRWPPVVAGNEACGGDRIT